MSGIRWAYVLLDLTTTIFVETPLVLNMSLKMGRVIHSQLLRIKLVILCLLIMSPGCYANGHVRYGIDSGGSGIGTNTAKYVNMLASAGPWYPAFSATPIADLTPTGYPTSTPSSGMAAAFFSVMGYRPGLAYFSGKGNFTVAFFPPSIISVVPGTMIHENNTTSCVVKLTPPASGFPGGQSNVPIQLTNIDPLHPPDDFKLICPGPYGPNSKQVFTNDFLAAERPFSIIRGGVDNSPTEQIAPMFNETDWNTRVDPTQFGQWGMSFEAQIAYCNATLTDPWFMVPVNTTPNWWIGLATLVHKTLDPRLHCYIEFNNENWNYGYGRSWGINVARSLANPALTPSTNTYVLLSEQVGFQIMEIYKIMHPILGAQARFVYMGQTVGMSYTVAPGLAWIAKHYGPPSQYLYAIGGAFYFVAPDTDTDLTSLFASMTNSINATNFTALQQCKTMANEYGLKLVLYEGGEGLTGDPAVFNVQLAAQLDPRMYSLYSQMGAVMEATGVESICLTCDCGYWLVNNGFWGQITDTTQWNANVSPKYMAAAALAKAGAQSPARSVAAKSSTAKHHNGH